MIISDLTDIAQALNDMGEIPVTDKLSIKIPILDQVHLKRSNKETPGNWIVLHISELKLLSDKLNELLKVEIKI